MATQKIKTGLFSSVTIKDEVEFIKLKDLVKKAQNSGQKTINFKNHQLNVAKLSLFFAKNPTTHRDLPTPDEERLPSKNQTRNNQNNPAPNTTSLSQKASTINQTSSQIKAFLEQNRHIIETHNSQITLSISTSNAANTVLGGRLKLHAVQDLQTIAYQFITKNPMASKADIVRWTIDRARVLNSPKVPINNSTNTPKQAVADDNNWLENHKVIERNLNRGGLRIVQSPGVSPSIEGQISSQIAANDISIPKGRVDKIARDIAQAAEAVGASTNPNKFQAQDIAKEVEHTLRAKGNNLAAQQVKNVHSQLIQLTAINTHQNILKDIGPTQTLTPGLGSPVAQKNTQTILTLTQNSGQKASTIAASLSSHRSVINQNLNPSTPLPFFERLRRLVFFQSTPRPIYYETIAYQTDYRQHLSLSQSNKQSGSSPLQIIRMFSKEGGGLNLGSLGKFGDLLKKGGGGLKNLFGMGKNAGGLIGGGAKAAAAVNATGAAVAGGATSFAWVPVVIGILVIFGVLIVAERNRFNLDTGAEVRTFSEGGGQFTEQSKYASLKKEADITKLEDPVGKITYTYTIEALQGSITITSFVDKTTIFQESGERTLSLDTQPEEPPAEIATNFTSGPFSLTLDSSMDDSIISNAVEITFINPEGATETISSTAVTIIGNPPFCPPTLPPIEGAYKSGYEYRCEDPTCEFPPKGHCGVDLGGSKIIKSPFNCQAVVSRVQTSSGESFGHYVVLNSGPYYAFFAHMDGGSIAVSSGEFVAPGQVLGTMDNTGNSSGDHLHYEVRSTEKGSVSVGSNCQPPISINPCEIPGSQIAGLCN